jgi:hypothetical protein
MRRLLLLLAMVSVMTAGAQAPGAQAGTQPVVDGYYKLAPGKTEEWLALYKKWHLPILLEQRKAGRILGITIYQPQVHTGGWDFKVTLRYASFAAWADRDSTAEITRRLFPNAEELARNERRRWEITERHWDEVMVEAPGQP